MQQDLARMQARPSVPWDELQDFHAIAQTGQLGRAGRSRGVDASTMGRRLRRLEARLGQVLFEQTREGQVLTEAGEALLAHVEAMHGAAAPIQELPAGGTQLAGLLRVSVSEGFGTWFVAAHLHDFHRRHPQVAIDLAATSGLLSPSKRETDVAVLLARPRTGPVVSGKLSDYTLRLYAARRYLDAGAPIGDVEDLIGHPLVGYIPDLLYAPELRYLGEIDARLVPTVRSSSINAQYRLIASGTGVGVLPRFIGDADPALVPVLAERQITRSFWMVTHKDTRQLHRVRAFREWLTETVALHRQRLIGG